MMSNYYFHTYVYFCMVVSVLVYQHVIKLMYRAEGPAARGPENVQPLEWFPKTAFRDLQGFREGLLLEICLIFSGQWDSYEIHWNGSAKPMG